MTTITLIPGENPTHEFKAEGRTFGEACAKLLGELERMFNMEPFQLAPVLAGLAELATGEDKYEHVEMGTPEDNFTLTVKD